MEENGYLSTEKGNDKMESMASRRDTSSWLKELNYRKITKCHLTDPLKQHTLNYNSKEKTVDSHPWMPDLCFLFLFMLKAVLFPDGGTI